MACAPEDCQVSTADDHNDFKECMTCVCHICAFFISKLSCRGRCRAICGAHARELQKEAEANTLKAGGTVTAGTTTSKPSKRKGRGKTQAAVPTPSHSKLPSPRTRVGSTLPASQVRYTCKEVDLQVTRGNMVVRRCMLGGRRPTQQSCKGGSAHLRRLPSQSVANQMCPT